MDKKDLKILIRLHEIYEANLMLVSKDFEYSAPRDRQKLFHFIFYKRDEKI